MNVSVSILLGLVLAQAGGGGTDARFHPDDVLTPPGGPEIVIFRSVPPEVVSLRLSVPLRESREEAGAGQLIQVQAQDRMQVLAARIGARAEVHRTPQSLVYEVSGTAADLDFLGWILREGLRAPAASSFEAARRRVQVELDRQLETPQGVLFQRIREALVPDSGPLSGTTGSLDRMDASRLGSIWDRSHRRERLRIVVAARLSAEAILAATAGLGLPSDAPGSDVAPAPDTGSPRPAPQVIRHWVVDAYPLVPASEGRTLVAARWLGEHLRAMGGDFETGVEIWDLGGFRALVISGAAYPRSRQAMEGRVRAAPQEAVARLTEGDVARIARALRTEILMTARTPWGLTELVGQAWDAGHGPDGLESLLAELESASLAEVVDFLEGLAATTPVREALNP